MIRKLIPRHPSDPAMLALRRAEVMGGQTSDATPAFQDERNLAELEVFADRLGFLGSKYFVESHRSLSIPVAWDPDEPVMLHEFLGLTFEGKFETYSLVEVGRIIGSTPVRALCLSFSDATLLPFLDKLPDDHLLYVPVLAVESIDAQAA